MVLAILGPHEGIFEASLMEALVGGASVETGHSEGHLEGAMLGEDKGSPMSNFPKGLIIRIGPLRIRIIIEITI